MRAKAFFLASSLMAGFALSAAAQWVGKVHLLPVVAKNKGQAGTDWVSDVAVSNLSGSRVALQFLFFKENTDNVFLSAPEAWGNLAEGGSNLIPDVLGSLFPQVGNSTKGALAIIASDPSGTDPEPHLAVSSRTYNNADPNRTYGQTVPSVSSPAAFMVWGAGKAVLPGIRQDSRFRTNIGVVNLSSLMSPSPPRLKVKLRFVGPTGAPIREVGKEVEALSLRQLSLTELGVTSLLVGRVEITVDPTDPLYQPCQIRRDPQEPGALFVAYYSKVDNATGDAEFSLAQVDWSEYQVCPEPPGGNPCK